MKSLSLFLGQVFIGVWKKNTRKKYLAPRPPHRVKRLNEGEMMQQLGHIKCWRGKRGCRSRCALPRRGRKEGRTKRFLSPRAHFLSQRECSMHCIQGETVRDCCDSFLPHVTNVRKSKKCLILAKKCPSASLLNRRRCAAIETIERKYPVSGSKGRAKTCA